MSTTTAPFTHKVSQLEIPGEWIHGPICKWTHDSAKKRKDLLFAATWMNLTMTQKKPDTKDWCEMVVYMKISYREKESLAAEVKQGLLLGVLTIEGDEEVFRGLAVFVILICG